MGLTVDRLRDLLRYDPDTGEFVWLPRQNDSREGKRWNTRYAGTVAGNKNLANGYTWYHVDGNQYRGHIIAWLYMMGSFPDSDIDHKDRDGFNNKWDNLREATQSQNCANKTARVDNPTGVKGVSWEGSRNKWVASIGVNYRKIKIGRFERIEDAKAAYDAAAEKYFGEFARSA